MTAGEYFGDWMEVIDGPELRRVVTWMSKLDKSILCPSSQNVFKAFQACSLKDCKVVFLGQDPYPQQGVATGILFGNSKDTPEEEKDWITMRMGVIAISENNLHLQICRLGKEYPGVYVEGCMSPKIFGLNIKPTKASITSGCTCSVQTYGIGEYDTCKMGCKYCYATIDHNLAKRIPENPNSELISGEITEPIKYVNNRVQISQELSLFD